VTEPEELPEGQCVCGRPLPDEPLSDWACSEPCQSAWMHHHAAPDLYPHPREIRAAADARPAGTRPRPQRPEQPVRDGTEINVDGQRYVRDGSHWEPVGMWTPLSSELATAVEYRRWCPRCRERRTAIQVSEPPARSGPAAPGLTQVCATCDHHWRGRPLLGVVETRSDPWPGLRLRLTDGQRSVSLGFTEEEIVAAGVEMAGRIERSWRRMERQLCGGVADVDQADEQTLARAGRRVARAWHLHVDFR
jgi:hypothetical protein